MIVSLLHIVYVAPVQCLQVNEAQLQDKSKNTILAAADDLVDTCQKALADSQDRLAAGEPLTGQAVLATWRDIRGINATLVVSRHRDLGILFKIFSKEVDLYQWRIPIEIPPPLNWSVEWTTDTADWCP
jgi:hypothetical protein